MNRVLRQLRNGAGAVALIAMLTPLIAGAAHADPDAEPVSDPSQGSEPAVAVTPMISWTQLGLSNRIDLSGSNQPTDVNVPVPQGVSPTLLSGIVGSIVNATGRIEVIDGRGITLGSIPIPLDAVTVPFAVDIFPADVNAGTAKLSLVIRDDGNERADSCVQAPAVTLTELATTYSGPTPNPRTVADFLPRYVDQITIQVGPAPSPDQQQAALTLVARLTHLYRPMPVRINVDTSLDSVPIGETGMRRTISIREGDAAGFVVENSDTAAAVLAISGRGPDLLRQVELFADRRFDLAQTSSAEVTSATPDVPKAADVLSFGELGMTPEASVIGITTMYLGFDVAAFGLGSVDRARFHLIAKYTPVTTDDASVLVRSGNVILASQILDESGIVDLKGEIAGGQIGANVGLALEIRYIPHHECAPLYDRITFAVDPESTISVSQGTDNRGGFPVLPMAFTPQFDVALTGPDQIEFAAQAINLMGQQATVALQPNVADLGDAAQRRTGLLVVATGEELTAAGIRPTLLFTDTDAVDVNGTPVTGVDVNGPLGVLQAFSSNDRMVLAIEPSGDPALLDQSFDYIRGLDGRWATLNGDVVATGISGTTVNLTVREGGSMTHQSIPSDGWKWWTWITLAVGVVVVVGLAAALMVRRRRARP